MAAWQNVEHDFLESDRHSSLNSNFFKPLQAAASSISEFVNSRESSQGKSTGNVWLLELVVANDLNRVNKGRQSIWDKKRVSQRVVSNWVENLGFGRIEFIKDEVILLAIHCLHSQTYCCTTRIRKLLHIAATLNATLLMPFSEREFCCKYVFQNQCRFKTYSSSSFLYNRVLLARIKFPKWNRVLIFNVKIYLAMLLPLFFFEYKQLQKRLHQKKLKSRCQKDWNRCEPNPSFVAFPKKSDATVFGVITMYQVYEYWVQIDRPKEISFPNLFWVFLKYILKKQFLRCLVSSFHQRNLFF